MTHGSARHAGATGIRTANRPHVLIVDDDPLVRAATTRLLASDGYMVTAAASSSEAIECVRSPAGASIRLLITDYYLGGASLGTEVIAVGRDVLGADLRAIVITGDTSSGIGELPRDRFLRITSKPVDGEELLGLIQSLLDG